MSENEEQEEAENPQETTPTGDEEQGEELDIQVGLENGRVILLFSQSLATLALPPDSAVTMAGAMLHYAKKATESGD